MLGGCVAVLTATTGVLAAASAAPPGSPPAAASTSPASGRSTFGAPVAPRKVRLTQPDGGRFAAMPYGDLLHNGYETLDGYTVVQTGETWVYAVGVDDDGTLVPGAVRPDDGDAPVDVPRHLRATAPTEGLEAVADGPAGAPSASGGPAPFVQNLGTQRSLVLLVEFDDQPHKQTGSTASTWAGKFFGATSSVAHYYDEVSYGQLAIQPAPETHGTAGDGIVGWLDLGQDHPDSNAPAATRRLTRDAILAANPYVDYASFDTDDDGALSPQELHVTVIVAGYETSYTGANLPTCGPSIWGHQWDTAGLTPHPDGTFVGGEGGSYTMFGERHCDPWNDSPGHLATLGIMVHELGHDLGLPDLYDYDGSSAGVGSWSIMGNSWTQLPGELLGSTPVHPDAWSKIAEGWVTPDLLATGAAIAVDQAATNPDAKQVRSNPGGVNWTFDGPGTGQFFVIENRQQVGYDAALPGCGVLVWHVDETRWDNADDARRLVDLEEADGKSHLDRWRNQGDRGDPFPGRTAATLFGPRTVPSSSLYPSGPSGFKLITASPACAPTMLVNATVAP